MYEPVAPNTAWFADCMSPLPKFVELGAALMDTVEGLHFTPLRTFSATEPMVSHAQRMIGLFGEKNISKERVVICVG